MIAAELVGAGWALAVVLYLAFTTVRGDRVADRILGPGSSQEHQASSALYPTAARSAVAVTKTPPAAVQTLRRLDHQGVVDGHHTS